MRLLIFVLALVSAAMAAAPLSANAEKLVHVVRFTDYGPGSIDDWLRDKGFTFEQAAKRRDRIDLDVGANGLVLQAKRRTFGFLLNGAVNVPAFRSIEIDWAVSQFPAGASYEQGVRNEALMVMFFIGDEYQPSGSMFVPDSPYFVGLFLCNGDDRLNHPYIGTYFKKGGRYVCTGKPTAGETVTSRFNLLEAYRTYFDVERDDDPAVSAVALSLDTQKAEGGGKAAASIREIRFYR